jgi:hypothetical protein
MLYDVMLSVVYAEWGNAKNELQKLTSTFLSAFNAYHLRPNLTCYDTD